MSMRKARLLMKRLMDFALRNKTIVYTREKEKRKRNICERKKNIHRLWWFLNKKKS